MGVYPRTIKTPNELDIIEAHCQFCDDLLGIAVYMKAYNNFVMPTKIKDEHEGICPVLREWKRCKE